MTTLHASRTLRQLHAAWSAAWKLNLGYGPDGIRYDRDRTRAHDNHECNRPDCPACTLPPSRLSDAYTRSVHHLSRAVVAASELSWVNDDVAQAAVLPAGNWRPNPDDLDGRPTHSHASASHGSRMLSEVSYALAGAHLRRDHLDLADQVHLRVLDAAVTDALHAMPRDLWQTTTVPIRPTLKRCIGGPGRQHCTTNIPWDRQPGYCDTCAERIEALVAEHPGHRGDPCRDPWDRDACRKLVKVPKYSLCDTCDQFRRNVLRQSAA